MNVFSGYYDITNPLWTNLTLKMCLKLIYILFAVR